MTTCVAASETPHPLWTAFLERVAPDPELRASCSASAAIADRRHDRAQVRLRLRHRRQRQSRRSSTRSPASSATTPPSPTSARSSPRNTERHPTDVAKLHGARLVVAQETEKGRRWDETKIKTMTGGDKMTARFMRQDFFDFMPKFKLLIVGNHKPRLDNVDEAMRRRLLLVPFTVQIPPDERDPDLPRKLKAEWPAILRW